jgi:hypothetical protein
MAQRDNRRIWRVPTRSRPKGRCPVQPSTPLGPDQVNVIIIIIVQAKSSHLKAVSYNPVFCLEKDNWGNPIRIHLGKDSSNEHGQSLPTENHVESSFTNDKGQSEIQDNLAVETHNLQSSEGQLWKPTESFGVDVIATPSLVHNEVNARSDDLLSLQAEQQLEHGPSGMAKVVLSLDPEPKILVSESTFTNCSLVRCETPSSRFQERRREMDEIEHFLKKDGLRFDWITRRIE